MRTSVEARSATVAAGSSRRGSRRGGDDVVHVHGHLLGSFTGARDDRIPPVVVLEVVSHLDVPLEDAHAV